jgi:16S rRNA processing protein RimM
MKSEEYITIAKIGAPFGVRGWLKIQTFTEDAESVVHYQPWLVADADGHFSPLAIEQVECKHGRLLAKIVGVDTPEAARLYTGRMLNIPRSALPKLKQDEFYWSDLKGLTVIDHHGVQLGTVSDLMETGSNDVLIVTVMNSQKQTAIPYLPGQVVKSVNLASQEIHVEWEPIE